MTVEREEGKSFKSILERAVARRGGEAKYGGDLTEEAARAIIMEVHHREVPPGIDPDLPRHKYPRWQRS